MIEKIKKIIVPSNVNELVGVKINPFILSFTDGAEEIEKEFLADYFEKCLPHIRICIAIGIFLYSIFAIVDFSLDFTTNILYKHLTIRFVVVSILIAIYFFSYSEYFKYHLYSIISGGVVMAGFGIIGMMVIDPMINYSGYSMGLILVFMVGLTFVRCRFIYSLYSCLIILSFYEFFAILEFLKDKIDLSFLINDSFHLISAYIIGLFVCYSIEKYARNEFLMVRQLNLLNEFSKNLYECKTESESFAIIKNSCQKLFPDSSGYILTMDKSETKLQRVIGWGNSFDTDKLISFDECHPFHTGNFLNEKQQCLQNDFSDSHSCCHPIITEKKWGVFHIVFDNIRKNSSNEQYKKLINAKNDTVKRMIAQYTLFLKNLRLRIIDPLTGLYNRIYMSESLEKEIKDKNAGIIMIDIDDFRLFNEKNGNSTGDKALIEISGYFRQNISEKDIVCRYSGNQFILIFHEIFLMEAAKKAESFRIGISDYFNSYFTDIQSELTVSIGVAAFPEHGSDLNTVITAVNKALNRAKSGGGNRVVVL